MSRIERCLKCGEIIADKVHVVTISEQGAVGSLMGIAGKNKVFGLCAACSQRVSDFIVSGSSRKERESLSEKKEIHFHA